MPVPELHGLDIHGTYQPVTDWAAIPAFPLMSVKATEGANSVQRNGAAYFEQFRRRGFRYRGAYHWLRSDSTAKAQFENIRRWFAARGGMLEGEFVQNDWEHTPGIPDPPLSMVLEFNDRCQQEWPGRLIVYVSDWVTQFHQWLATNPIEPIWYANYNTGLGPNGGWAECAKYTAEIWQYTSKELVPGIATRCDGNHVFDFAALDRIAGRQPAPPTTIPPVTPPDPTTPMEDPMPGRLYRKKSKTAVWLADGITRIHVPSEQHLATLTPPLPDGYGPVIVIADDTDLDAQLGRQRLSFTADI